MNRATTRNKCPLLRIENLFNELRGATIFSKKYLRSIFHIVRIKEKDIHKTTLRMRYVNYDFVVVPFGLTNSLAKFMSLMKNVLS